MPFTITGANGVQGVIDSVRNGAADIGFVAFDPVRAEQVDFSQNYALAQNTYLVPENSPIKSVADADRAGVRIGVGARDAGDYFLTRTLKTADAQAQRRRHRRRRDQGAARRRDRRLCGQPDAPARRRAEDAAAYGSCPTISTASNSR